MSALRRETLAAHPTPPSSPLEALAHVLAIYKDSPDEMVVMQATINIYPEAPWTGLRLGDLRALLSDHAHELAERQRDMLRGGFRMPMFATILTTGGHEPLGTTHVIDDIDPEITTIRPARVALAELQPEGSGNG